MRVDNFGIGILPRLFAAAALFFAAAELSGAETTVARLKYGTRIVCPGEYRGHLQGIATDGKAIYWVFSRDIVKTGLDGRLLARRGMPYHSGDPCWHDGKLYVPLCQSGFNRKLKAGAASKNYVCVFDADLKPIKKYHIPELEYGAGGIAVKDGRFFVVGGRPDGLPGNTVCEYDADFKLLGRHEANFDSLKGIQTANYASGRWYFGCYGTGGLTVETDEKFQLTRRLRPGVGIGAVILPGGKVLVGELLKTGSGKRGGAAARVVRFTEAPPKDPPAAKPRTGA